MDRACCGLSDRIPHVDSMVVILIAIKIVVLWLVDGLTSSAGGWRWLATQMSLFLVTILFWLDRASGWLWWKLLTYGFAHSSIGSSPGFWHLFGNTYGFAHSSIGSSPGFCLFFGLFVFGRAIEQKLGRYEFLRFYLVSVVASGFCWLLISQLRGPCQIVGASGAVSAVVGLFVFSYPREKILLFFVIPIPAWLLGVLLVVGDIYNSVSSASQVAGEAHLAGFGFAALYFYQQWNFSRFSFSLPKLSGPRLKIHDPDRSERQLQVEGDRILAKLHRDGEESLSRKERKTLEKYSRMLRKKKS